MLIIGEKINATSKRVAEAIVNKDAGFIQELARQQVEAGADYIDVNAGTGQGIDQEISDLKWAIDAVREAVDTPLCLDSSDPQALAAATAHYSGTALIINSVNAEAERLDPVGRVAAERGARLIALVMGEGGIPRTVEERVAVARRVAIEIERRQREGTGRRARLQRQGAAGLAELNHLPARGTSDALQHIVIRLRCLGLKVGYFHSNQRGRRRLVGADHPRGHARVGPLQHDRGFPARSGDRLACGRQP